MHGATARRSRHPDSSLRGPGARDTVSSVADRRRLDRCGDMRRNHWLAGYRLKAIIEWMVEGTYSDTQAAAAAGYLVAGLDMKVHWDFTAEAFLDQLPSQERAKVIHAVQRLSAVPDDSNGPPLTKLAGVQSDLYSLRAGSDLQVLLRKRDETVTVVDVVRRSQVEGLRRLQKQGQSAAE